MTHVRGSKARTKRNTVISEEEFQQLLTKADKIKNVFFRYRAKALLCILRLTGKRRNEIARLELEDFKKEDRFLTIRFTLEKKKRRFKVCPKCEAKNTVKAQFCKLCGINIAAESIMRRGKREDSVKAIPLTDPYAQPILEYLEYLQGLEPKPRHYFPSVRSVFGHYAILLDKHLSGRQLFNIVRLLSPRVWLHLFRETVASDVIRQDPTIIGAFKVQRRLDLESYQTGFNYLKRFAADVIQRETKTTESIDVIKTA